MIQGGGFTEAMQKKGAHEPFLDEFLPLLDQAGTASARLASQHIQSALSELSASPAPQAQWIAKSTLATLADAAQVALLYALADIAGERYAKLAELYATHFLQNQPYPAWALNDSHIWHPLPISNE